MGKTGNDTKFVAGPDDRRGKGGARAGAGRTPDWLRERCRDAGPNLINFLIEVAEGKDVQTIVTDEGDKVKAPAEVKDRVRAAEMVLNRGYGMPNQPISGPDETELPGISTPVLSEIIAALRARASGKAGGRA